MIDQNKNTERERESNNLKSSMKRVKLTKFKIKKKLNKKKEGENFLSHRDDCPVYGEFSLSMKKKDCREKYTKYISQFFC